MTTDITSEVIPLVEYGEVELDLARGDVAHLVEVTAGRFRVSQNPMSHAYRVNPQQYVGVVPLPSGRRIVVQPKVPISSVAHMLAIVHGLPEWGSELAPFSAVEDLLDHAAMQLVMAIEQQLQTGLQRKYVSEADNLTLVRGRINFASNLRHNYGLQHRIYCEYTELMWDIPENQVLRQALRAALGTVRSSAVRGRMMDVDIELAEVAVGQYSPSVFDRFDYHRGNWSYQALHALSRLFIEGASLGERAGSVTARAFLVDMNLLFEDFVRRILRQSITSGVTVTKRDIDLDEHSKLSVTPDLLFQQGGVTYLVADCKYKALTSGWMVDDVYQLLSYCVAEHVDRGVLFYPSIGAAGDGPLIVRGTGIEIRKVPVDLSQPVEHLSLLGPRLLEIVAPSRVIDRNGRDVDRGTGPSRARQDSPEATAVGLRP